MKRKSIHAKLAALAVVTALIYLFVGYNNISERLYDIETSGALADQVAEIESQIEDLDAYNEDQDKNLAEAANLIRSMQIRLEELVIQLKFSQNF